MDRRLRIGLLFSLLFSLCATAQEKEFESTPLEVIEKGWETKTIDRVINGSLGIMLERFDQTWPTWMVGAVRNTMEKGLAKEVLDKETELTVTVDAKNGYAELKDGGTDGAYMSACVWNRSNGHKLLAVRLGKPTDPCLEFVCFYDYDAQKKTLTPEPDILKGYRLRDRPEFTQLLYTLPRVGKNLTVEEWGKDGHEKYTFTWDGMKPVYAKPAAPASNASALTIKDGSRWWDGTRLYTATVDKNGNVRMEGESEDMGGDSFLLNKVDGEEGHYTLASTNSHGWIFIRGQLGWRVDYIRQEGMNFLAVRKPNGDCCYTLTLTPDNLKNCVAQQKIAEERDVSWMLQNYLLNTRYLGRFSKAQLRLLRNEILARHGWKFQSKDLQEYFGKQSWYKPVADNSRIKLNIIELTNVQLIKSDEAEDDDNRVRYENSTVAPKMVEAVDGVITVTTEEQFINALGNNRIIELGENVHLNLSNVLEREEMFSGVPGRAWVTVAERGGGDKPLIISEYCNDGQQLVLKNIRGLTIRGKHNASIEVNPRYSFCLSFMDCEGCIVENLTIGHTEGGYCDGGVIGVEGGSRISVFSCDLYGCGTYGVVARQTREFSLYKTNIHDCTYGIMELYSSQAVKFLQCDFFNNREFDLIAIHGSEDVVFEECRFFANWPDVPLFVSDEDFKLIGCEVYHPIIGAQKRIVAPKHDNKFGDDASFIPEPRKQPIGPDVK